MQKSLSIENLTGGEYYLPTGSTVDSLSTFIWSSEEVITVYQYNQNEFIESYWPNQCTIYWPMTALSCVVGRQLTKDERWEIATLGTKRDDWDPSMWANVSTWVDVVRKWWNEKNPDNPVVSFMIENTSTNRRNIYKKRYSYVSGFYGNQKYNEDASDGVLDGVKFWVPTYGHCTAELLSTVLDNYNNKYDRKDYFGCVRNYVTHRTGFVFFRENGLSESAKKQLSAMRKGIWNGQNANVIATRIEVVTMVGRYFGKTPDQLKKEWAWNGKNGDQPITLEELTTIYTRLGLTNIPKDTKRWSIAETLG